MRSSDQQAIIKATVPLLETGGEALPRHFYGKLLGDNPGIHPLFNGAHQVSGAQTRTVVLYARHIDRLDTLGPLIEQSVNKHVSLQVQPDHYPLVGSALLQSIREVLGAEVATDAVIDAWAAAYGQPANVLIAPKRSAMRSGQSARRLAAGKAIASASSIGGVVRCRVACTPRPTREPCCSYAHRHAAGVVQAVVGDRGRGRHHALAAHGVEGHHGRAPLQLSHCTRPVGVQAFSHWLEAQAAHRPQLQRYFCYSEPIADEALTSRLDRLRLQRWLPKHRELDAYVLGPVPSMVQVRRDPMALGVPERQIRHEFFGAATDF